MIYVFSGDDRVKIQAEIRKILGEDYEVVDGENLKPADLMSIMMGGSLLSAERKILIKDLTPARGTATETGVDFYAELNKFVDTPHTVVIWETTVPNRGSYREFIKNQNVKSQKIVQEEVDKWAIFRIFDLAQTDGKKAAAEFEKLGEDPYLALGAFATAAIKNYEKHQGRKEKRVLEALSDLDMKMKTTSLQPSLLLQAFLLRVSSL